MQLNWHWFSISVPLVGGSSDVLGKLHASVEGRSSRVCVLVHEFICWLGRFCLKPLSACVKSMSFPSNNWKMSSAWPLVLHSPPLLGFLWGGGLWVRRGGRWTFTHKLRHWAFQEQRVKKYVVREKSTWRTGYRYSDYYWASSVYNTFQAEKDDSNSSPADDFFYELG